MEILNNFEPRYDPPSRVTVANRVLERLNDLRPVVKTYMSTLSGFLYISTDAWSSVILKGHLAISFHWISDWKMKSLLIAFKYFPAPHGEAAICERALTLFNELELSDKVFCVILENGLNVLKGLNSWGWEINGQH